MGRDQDVTSHDVTKLLAVAEKVAVLHDADCGGCQRDRGRSVVISAVAIAGCMFCLARQVLLRIRLRTKARRRILDRKRANLREVGRRIRDGAHVQLHLPQKQAGVVLIFLDPQAVDIRSLCARRSDVSFAPRDPVPSMAPQRGVATLRASRRGPGFGDARSLSWLIPI